MSNTKSIDLRGTMTGAIICFLIGVISLLVGTYYVYTKTNFDGDAKKTKAEICQVSHKKVSNREGTVKSAQIEYSVDGKIYRSELDAPAIFVFNGAKLSVYYDSGNPKKYFSIGAIVFAVVLSALLTILGFLGAINNFKTSIRRKKQLL